MPTSRIGLEDVKKGLCGWKFPNRIHVETQCGLYGPYLDFTYKFCAIFLRSFKIARHFHDLAGYIVKKAGLSCQNLDGWSSAVFCPLLADFWSHTRRWALLHRLQDVCENCFKTTWWGITHECQWFGWVLVRHHVFSISLVRLNVPRPNRLRGRVVKSVGHLDHVWSYGVWEVVSSIPDRGNIVGWVFPPDQVTGKVFSSEHAFPSKVWIYLEHCPRGEAVITGHLRLSSMRWPAT